MNAMLFLAGAKLIGIDMQGKHIGRILWKTQMSMCKIKNKEDRYEFQI